MSYTTEDLKSYAEKTYRETRSHGTGASRALSQAIILLQNYAYQVPTPTQEDRDRVNASYRAAADHLNSVVAAADIKEERKKELMEQSAVRMHPRDLSPTYVMTYREAINSLRDLGFPSEAQEAENKLNRAILRAIAWGSDLAQIRGIALAALEV